MGHIKEPTGIDFVIESTPLTNTEKKEISEIIKKLKKRKVTRLLKIKKKSKIAENQ